ncbi:MAG: hypothetical protein IPO80_04800 [Propionibacteriaceae bacterium]|nr:hypothetical protein [Propionibacteriaceae bacterium]
MLWPTERGGRLAVGYVNARFREYADDLGLPRELHPHCLRHYADGRVMRPVGVCGLVRTVSAVWLSA